MNRADLIRLLRAFPPDFWVVVEQSEVHTVARAVGAICHAAAALLEADGAAGVTVPHAPPWEAPDAPWESAVSQQADVNGVVDRGNN
jgi:putative intracellular protease/amidase